LDRFYIIWDKKYFPKFRYFITLVTVENNEINLAWKNKESLFSTGLSVHDGNAKMFYNMGNYYFKEKNYKKAKVFFREALRLHKCYASAYNNLAAIYEDTDVVEAEKNYKKAIYCNKHNPSAYTNLARILVARDDVENAVTVLLSVVNGNAYYFTALLNLAKIMRKKGYYIAAENLYHHAIIHDQSSTADPYLAYGKFLTEIERYQDSIKVLDRGTEIDKHNLDLLLSMGWNYFELGGEENLKEAEKIFKRAESIKATADVYVYLGMVELKRGYEAPNKKLQHQNKAKKYHKIAVDIEPNNPERLVRWAIVLADSGELERAMELLEEAKQKDPDCRKSYNVHLWLSRMYAQKQKFVFATSTLEACYGADLESEVLAEIKSELGSFYSKIARDLRGSSQMESNKDPEGTLRQSAHVRQRAIDVLTEATNHKPGDLDIKVKLAQV